MFHLVRVLCSPRVSQHTLISNPLRVISGLYIPPRQQSVLDVSKVLMIPDNLRIYPKQPATFALAPNPAIITFPLHTLHLLPPAIHHTIVCLSLNHFINSLPSGTDREIALTNRSKAYHHCGAALRALGKYIAQDKTRCGDFTIASILMFLCLEVSLPDFYVLCGVCGCFGTD
jgi:hypothetical protein